jgi:pyruvate/2-oxoglutarate dehydrogenase complex dihydrolipoamide acyltransferase (E2) component
MVAGTIIEWLVKPGDIVKRGDIIAVVDTEKATIEVEVFIAGIIESIMVPAGEKVPVGTPLAQINADEAPPILREVRKSRSQKLRRLLHRLRPRFLLPRLLYRSDRKSASRGRMPLRHTRVSDGYAFRLWRCAWRSKCTSTFRR